MRWCKFWNNIWYGKLAFKRLIDMAKQAQKSSFQDSWNYFVFLLDNYLINANQLLQKYSNANTHTSGFNAPFFSYSKYFL